MNLVTDLATRVVEALTPGDTLPTRRDEAWRYADLAALADVWPLAPAAAVRVAAGAAWADVWLPTGEAIAVRRATIEVAAGASARLNALIHAPRYARVELDVTLGEGANFELDAALVAGGSATVEIVTNVRHEGRDATSRQTVRNIVGGRATGTYLGTVAVARGADGTDGQQSVKSLLLSREAVANAVPQLEIYADDVACAHGATVGQLDADQLFYAAARGIDPAAAKTMLLDAFVGELWDGLGEDDRGICDAARALLAGVAA